MNMSNFRMMITSMLVVIPYLHVTRAVLER
jgi:hypothetical protein